MPDEPTAEKPPWYIDAIKTLGLPTVFLCVMSYAVWSAGIWTGNEVVMPLFKKQMDFIDQASKMTTQMTETTEAIDKTLNAHSQHSVETLKLSMEVKDITSKNGEVIRGIKDSNDKIIDVLKNIDENTKSLRDGMP